MPPIASILPTFSPTARPATTLPRKFSIGFSGCESDCAQGLLHDLGVVVTLREGVPGFRLQAGLPALAASRGGGPALVVLREVGRRAATDSRKQAVP